MKDTLLPPPPIKAEYAAEVWVEMIDTGERLVRAGITSRCHPSQIEEKYSEWDLQDRIEHDQRLQSLLLNLSQRENRRAG